MAKQMIMLKENMEETILVRRLFEEYRWDMMEAWVSWSEGDEGQYKEHRCPVSTSLPDTASLSLQNIFIILKFCGPSVS